ncbi:DUF262 domain-containing protein [Arthrobacter sp. NPDC090010]|uniref:DUF262 domain-containing protein n=1 Tax=Arthrobacter sp. NPDC090010 TaxID=3363942 RepID=UPI00380A47F5
MKFDAVQRAMGEVILAGEHIVPRYQRPYAWDDENATDLWRDLKGRTVESHFLGNMVVHQSGPDQWDVVDGQQRLTTILIALRAVKDVYEEVGQSGRASGLSVYIQRVDLSGEQTFRLQYRTESGYLHLSLFTEPGDVIREKSPSSEAERAQYSAYSIFRQKITEEMAERDDEPLATLDEIRDRFLKATVVYVRVGDRQSAFRIFETLNDRGKSLNQVDLVKNQVISAIPPSAGGEEESLWAEIVRNIESSSWSKVGAEDFLGYFWNSTCRQADNEIVAVSRIRRSVDGYMATHLSPEEPARDFIRIFSQTAEIFQHFDECLASPNGKHWKDVVPESNWRPDKFEEIDKVLYGCLVASSNLPLPLLFSLLRNYIFGPDSVVSKLNLIDFLRSIENLQFRWSISQKASTSTIRKAYRKAAYAVDCAKTKEDVIRALRSFKRDANSLMPTDPQFRAGLEKLAYFNQRPQDVYRIRWILERIEDYWGGSRLPRDRSMTLEHIEPQGARSIHTRQNFWVGRLGNLTLLPSDVNSMLPNDFQGKSAVLVKWVNDKDSVLVDQMGESSWGNKAAGRRMKELLDVAVRVWPKAMRI